jgi:hypothetical protein
MAKNLGKFVLVLVAMTAARVWAADPDDDAINSRSFSIPIGFTGGQKERIHEVELFVSSDEGKTWQRTSVIPPDKDGFTYTAPTDGMYWFKTCIIDKMGVREPNDIYKSGKAKKILVDTLPPTLRIVKAERQGDRAQGEQVMVSWEIQELNPDLNTLKLEYKTSDGFWYPATIIPAMIGQAKFRPQNSGTITIRMKVSDLAGNQSVAAEAEVPGQEIASNLTTTSMQVPNTSSQSNSGTPAPSFPEVKPAAQTVANPPFTPPAPVNSYVPPAQAPTGPAPVIPSAYSGAASGLANGIAAGQGSGQQGGSPIPYNAPRMSVNSTLEKAPANLVMGSGNAGNAPAGWQQNYNQQAAANAHQPEVRNYGGNWVAPATPATGGAGGAGLPPGNPAGYVATRWINNTQTQITNTTQITLNYRVDRIGPSGVGAVDLYLTKDEGRTWIRYAEDADLTPPMVVDLPGEGVFGLRLVVTSKAGLGRRPPQSGDVPDIRVEVDMTAPVVKMYRPEPDPRKRDAIVLTWEASDHELAANPITLQWAERPDGTWNTIATDLANSQRYVWTVPQNLVQVYLRVVARDMAGNQGFDETAEPILVDLHEPEAKILGISSGIRR